MMNHLSWIKWEDHNMWEWRGRGLLQGIVMEFTRED